MRTFFLSRSTHNAHAHAVARIGDETLEYEATVSATALYLLKSLREDHQAYEEEQFPALLRVQHL